MDPSNQVGAKGLVHSAVPLNPAHRAERIGFDAHTEMAFATFLIARMTPLTFAFINDFKVLWREAHLKCCSDFFRSRHFFAPPPSISEITV